MMCDALWSGDWVCVGVAGFAVKPLHTVRRLWTHLISAEELSWCPRALPASCCLHSGTLLSSLRLLQRSYYRVHRG